MVENTESLEVCSDGKTNLKYCTKPLYKVHIVVHVTVKHTRHTHLHTVVW